MAFTSADLATIEAAMVSVSAGSKPVEVTIGGKRIRYTEPDLSKMAMLRSIIIASLAQGGTINKVQFNDPT